MAFVHTGTDLVKATEELGEDLKAALEWGSKNGITFGPGKCELQDHSRKTSPRRQNPKLQVQHYDVSQNKVTDGLVYDSTGALPPAPTLINGLAK